MLRVGSVEMNCLLLFKGHSEASLRKLAIEVVLEVPVAILKQVFFMVFSLSRRVEGSLIYVKQS